MIELRNLDKTFQDIHAVNHVSTVIQDGIVFGLIGSNGSGKSTLMRMNQRYPEAGQRPGPSGRRSHLRKLCRQVADLLSV